jgi:hypothetical protein
VLVGGLLAGDHPEVVRRIAEVGPRRDRVESLAPTVCGGGQDRDLCGHPDGVALTLLGCEVPDRLELQRPAKHGQGGAKPGHRTGRGWRDGGQSSEGVHDLFRERLGFHDRRAKGGELVGVGEAAAQEKVPDLLDRAGARHVDGIVLAVVVEPLLPATSDKAVVATITPARPGGATSASGGVEGAAAATVLMSHTVRCSSHRGQR